MTTPQWEQVILSLSEVGVRAVLLLHCLWDRQGDRRRYWQAV